MNSNKEFLNYIHFFRGFAIVIIVGIHCRISLPWSEDQVLGRTIFTTLLDNGTVLFVFIAGFLFQYLKNKYQFNSYFKRKLRFVILPYLLISIPILLYKYLFPQEYPWLPSSLAEMPYIIKAGYMILTGKHIGPFWFIPMIFIFYLISPLLVKIDQPKFYSFVFPILFLGGLFTFRFGYYSTIIDSFIHYLPIYIFGMWAASQRHEIIRIKKPWVVLLIILYVIIAFLEVINVISIPKLTDFISSSTLPYFAFNWAKLKACILCIICLRIFYMYNEKNSKVLKILADDSFGIYFVHMYFITLIEYVLNKYYPIELNVVYFILYIMIVTLGSIISIEIVKKIMGSKSRMVIGS